MPGARYINFNAGTLGAVMVEGRISSSAIVGAGSDVGGGASILGVLSGTDGNPISIGENTLLGANSVTGLPLGDACIVDAGIAVLEGTKIYISKEEFEKVLQHWINKKENIECLYIVNMEGTVVTNTVFAENIPVHKSPIFTPASFGKNLLLRDYIYPIVSGLLNRL